MSDIILPNYDGNVIIAVKCFAARPGMPERELPEMTRRHTWPTHYPQLLNVSKPETILSAQYAAETWTEYARLMTWVTQEVASWLPLYTRAEIWLSLADEIYGECSDDAILACQVMGVVDGD